jgi:hypothetical protein
MQGMMNEPGMVKKPQCKIIGENSNVFSAISIASAALNKEGMEYAAKEMTAKALDASSYNEVLGVIMGYVDVS